MAGKRLLFKSAAREKGLSGATVLADAVRITLGPKSKCVLILKKWGRPIVCNDGITIAKEVELEDRKRMSARRWPPRRTNPLNDGVGFRFVRRVRT